MIRSALFVDFDNVFHALKDHFPDSASAFAWRPGDWLAWFLAGGHAGAGENGVPAGPRRILQRRCYLNPGPFGDFRARFVQSGFDIVDCPSLNRAGKNAADIRMTVDIMEALGHPTRFDEFIILSRDADFTPVLLKLREHDRMTAALADATTAMALKAAAGAAIPLDMFVAEAVKAGADPCAAKAPCVANGATKPKPAAALRDRVLDAVEAMLAASVGPLHGSAVGSMIRQKFGGEIDATKWCGAGSMGKLLKTANRPGLAMGGAGGGQVFDPRPRLAAATPRALPLTG